MRRGHLGLTLGSLAAAALLVALPGAPVATAHPQPGGHTPHVTIRYTEHGVPHILADDFTGAGYGYGYAVARDDICVLANSFTTVSGERSRYFGPDGPLDDTVTGATSNLASDLYFHEINDAHTVERLVAQPDPEGPRKEVRDIVAGYVKGYNRYLAQTGRDGIADPACHGAAWLRPIDETDVYRLVHALTTYAGQGGLVDGIAGARPDPSAAPLAANAATAARFESGIDQSLVTHGQGSNAIALGSQGVARGRSLLLGNPHFLWRGVDRFYQAQLTVPGKLDVTGASLLAAPFFFLGYNDDVAWTHTWSSALTFGLYEVHLAPGDPTSYLVDGVPEKMTQRTVRVAVKQPDGTLSEVVRTLYSTRYGPMLTSGVGMSLPWTKSSGYAVRDANATNMRYLNTSFAMASSHSTAGVVRALSHAQGIPLLNTLAVDRAGHSLYADIQVVPHVTDALARSCGTPLGGQIFPRSGLPILDGSRSACAWGSDPGAVEPGLFAPDSLPRLERSDFVLNSNQSPWLTNPNAPVTGYPRIVGDVGTERTPRTRESITSVQEALKAGGFTKQSMQKMLFADRSRVAVLAAHDTAAMCAAFPGGMAPSSNGPVDVSQACGALASWNGAYTLDSRGSLLFERFVMRMAVPDAPVPGPLPWKTPFDPANPVTTPNTLDTARPDVQKAFGDAAADLLGAHIPLDAELGDHQTVTRGSESIPMPGGAWPMGLLNVVHPIWDPARGNVEVGTGSSFIQVVSFGKDRCPDASTLLTSSQSADPTSPYYADQTRMFSAGQWATGRFCEKDIMASPALRIVHLS